MFRLTPVLLFPLALACGDAPDRPATVFSGGAPAGVAPTHGDSLPGVRLAGVLGCGACHPGAPAPEPAHAAAPGLNGLAARWDIEALTAYLADPVPLREGVISRMPDFGLDSDEAAALATYLLSDSAAREPAGRGAAIAEALNCAGCHEGLDTPAHAPGPPVAGIRERVRPAWLRGYLAAPGAVRPFGYHPGSGSRMPDFRLSSAEADSLGAWLAAGDDGPGGAGEGTPVALSAFAASKAETLLRDHLPCLGCHALRGEGGRIGPALEGVGARLRPDYLRRVVAAPAHAVPGTVMPAPLEDSATVELVTRYLYTLNERPADTSATAAYLSLMEHEPRPRAGAAAMPRRGRAAEGADLYAYYCASCHGLTGGGDGFNARYLPTLPTPHGDAAHMSGRADATLFDGIHAGGHILGRSHRMPAFGATLSSAEIRALVGHLRHLCACEQPAWAAAP